MQVLTPSGYVDIVDLNIGDEIVAYDINTGAVIINTLEDKQLWTPDMYPPDEIPGGYVQEIQIVDVPETIILPDGTEEIIMVPTETVVDVYVPPTILKTSYEVFQSINGDWKMYKINDTWSLFKDQSVWANMRVIHASQLQIGDIVYNDTDGDVVITSIEEVDVPLEWWKLDVSGDSSYIADGITLHNASRYWVGGGSSSNWNATGNTNWGSVSGTQDNASVPTSADAVTFDGAGVAGNTNSTISATASIISLNITAAYTATMTHNAAITIGGNLTFGANYTIAGTSSIDVTAAATITSNGKTWPNALSFSNTNTKTLVGNLTVNGLFTSSAGMTLNKTTTEVAYLYGGFTSNGGTGTAEIICKGGTLTGMNGLSSPLTLDGNITFAGTSFGYGSYYVSAQYLKYVSGTNNASSVQLYYQSSGAGSLDVGSLTWNSIYFDCQYGPTITLISDLKTSGTTTYNKPLGFNTSTGAKLITNGISVGWGGGNIVFGTAVVELTGGSWVTTAGTAYIASSLRLNGNITVSGTVYYTSGTLTYVSGTITTTGATLTLGGCTLNTNGITWPAVTIPSGGTFTLTSNFATSGLVTISGATTVNKTASETFSCGGGLAVNSTLAGTATVVLTGGTWSGTNTTGIANNLNINGNVTISGNVYYGTGTISYVSGTVTNTGSTFNTVSGCTFNLNGMELNNLTFSGSSFTYNLTSNLTIRGFWSCPFFSFTVTINRSASENIYVYGGMTVNSYALACAAPIYARGGTLTTSGNGAVSGTLYLDGDIKIAPSYNAPSTLTYLSGNIDTSGSTLTLGNSVLNTKSVVWNNATISGGGFYAPTLVSDFIVNGLLTGGQTSQAQGFNTSNDSKLYVFGGIYLIGSNGSLGGSAEIVFRGGTLYGLGANLTGKVTIDGNITLGQNANLGLAGTLNYNSGSIIGSNPLNITDNASVTNFHKCPIQKVIVTSGKTVTMNQFFTGTPSLPASISCLTSGSTYNLIFQDNFEKVATNVIVSGCVVFRPMQLILSSPFKINTLKATNSGIRYVNQSPNGFAKNTPTQNSLAGGPAGGLVGDTNFTKQS